MNTILWLFNVSIISASVQAAREPITFSYSLVKAQNKHK